MSKRESKIKCLAKCGNKRATNNKASFLGQEKQEGKKVKKILAFLQQNAKTPPSKKIPDLTADEEKNVTECAKRQNQNRTRKCSKS